jgi:hypothetical protein
MARQGIKVLKFFLNLGWDEQRQRFLDRIDTPEKNWKFDTADMTERKYWDDYQHAYEAAIIGTATPEAPWIVVPADRKWLARLIVAETLVATLEAADPQYPGGRRGDAGEPGSGARRWRLEGRACRARRLRIRTEVRLGGASSSPGRRAGWARRWRGGWPGRG